jgi:hypothetical protein
MALTCGRGYSSRYSRAIEFGKAQNSIEQLRLVELDGVLRYVSEPNLNWIISNWEKGLTNLSRRRRLLVQAK